MDQVSDFCTRIRNACMARRSKVDIPYSKIQEGIALQLKNYGYIRALRTAKIGDRGLIRVYLKYKSQGSSAITRIERLSKPSCRRYVKVSSIPDVCSGYGLVILSTNKGILTGKEAKAKGVGGEALCQVW